VSLSREDIRSVICPKCRAESTQPCSYSGKGSQKAMRLGRSHFARMQLAQKEILNQVNFEVIE
jgi:hypothetical protein